MSTPNAVSLVKERNRPRALAPSREHGAHDPYNAFLTTLDPRGESQQSKAVQWALACSRDPRFQEFLRRLHQPRYQRYSLAAVAKSCDLILGEFLQFWHDALVESAIAIACSSAPAIVSDMAEDALSSHKSCERCDGLGWVESPAGVSPEMVPGYLGRLSDHLEAPAVRTCPACRGSAKIRKPGDQHAREKLLELAGLTGKRAPVQVVAFNFNRSVEQENRITLDVDPEEEDQNPIHQLGAARD